MTQVSNNYNLWLYENSEDLAEPFLTVKPENIFQENKFEKTSCQHCGQPGETFSVCAYCGGATSKANTGSKTNMREALDAYEKTTNLWQAREDARKFVQDVTAPPKPPKPNVMMIGADTDDLGLLDILSTRTFWFLVVGLCMWALATIPMP